jgi:hypothetical protein
VILFAAIAVAVLSVVLTGGKLARLQNIRFRAPFAIVAALLSQVLVISVLPTLPSLVTHGVHLASYGLAVAFLWANRRVPWLWLIGAGGLSNLAAISANAGVMPASKAALAEAGAYSGVRIGVAKGFANSAYHPGQHLRFLGDIFAIPKGWPFANVFSVGDVLIVTGCFLLLHVVGQSRLGRRLHRRAEQIHEAAGSVGADRQLLQHP